jgi:hypothetical protein
MEKGRGFERGVEASFFSFRRPSPRGSRVRRGPEAKPD